MVHHDKLWITGGEQDSKYNSGILKSTEYIGANSDSSPAPNLPFKLTMHSMVNINSTHTLIIGGRMGEPPYTF